MDFFCLIGVLIVSEVFWRLSCIFFVDSLEVYYECFGGCVGILEIDKYIDLYVKCIICFYCDGIFLLCRFVIYNYFFGEIYICYWGFDDVKWRFYLMFCNE